MKELWWEDKDIVSLMIKLISKKLDVQDFKNLHIYLTALSGLLSGCTIQTSPSQQDDLLVFTTIFSFIHWFFSVIITSQWLHYSVMTLLCLYLFSSVRLAFWCCCAEIFTMLLFTAQQTLSCSIFSFTIFNFTCMTSALLLLNVCTTFICTSSSCHYSSFRHVFQDKYLLSLR